jgi:hypothetical protein
LATPGATLAAAVGERATAAGVDLVPEGLHDGGRAASGLKADGQTGWSPAAGGDVEYQNARPGPKYQDGGESRGRGR